MPKMPGGDDGEKKEETAESREEAKEQVIIILLIIIKCVTHLQRHRINQPGAVETAGDQGQGEGADPVLPKAERGGQSGEN